MRKLIERFASLIFALVLLILLLKGDLFSSSLWVIIGQLAAITILVWSRILFRHQQFRPVAYPGSGPLVQTGPYRLIRHPMYAAGLSLIWVSILGNWSLVNASLGLFLTLVILFRINFEERLLRSTYPEYEAFSRRTKRLIPFVY